MVPDGWKQTELGTLADVAYGLTVNKQRREAKERAPYLRVANVKAGQLDLSEVKDMGVIGDDAERYRLLSKDILLVEGNGNPDLVGAACIWRNELTGALHQNHLIRIRSTATLAIPEWLLFYLNSASGHQQILGHAKTSSGLYTINSTIVRQLQLHLPPLAEQRKIAAILSSVDEAIEKTQAVIDQVQVVKKGLMQELLTRGFPGRHTKFKQTEIGEIPASWEVVELAKLGTDESPVVRTGPFGSSLKGEHFVPTGVPVLTIQSLGDGEIIDSGLFHVATETADVLREYRVAAGDLVFSRVADIGRSVVIPERATDWIISSNLMRISPDPNRVESWYLMYAIVGGGPVTQQIRAISGVGGRPVVSSAVLKRLLFPLPPIGEQQEISSLIRAAEEATRAHQRCLLGLQQLKQALMSVLLTGELRVTP